MISNNKLLNLFFLNRKIRNLLSISFLLRALYFSIRKQFLFYQVFSNQKYLYFFLHIYRRINANLFIVESRKQKFYNDSTFKNKNIYNIYVALLPKNFVRFERSLIKSVINSAIIYKFFFKPLTD